MTEGAAAPTRVDQRIDTLDVLRGVAICGILLMNIPGMGMTGTTERPPLPARWNVDWIAWGIQNLLFNGTMRGLFTILYGAGMLLMLRRTFESDTPVAPVDVWTRRCLALMALGVVQWAVLFWPGEILWNYGVVGFALLAFRTARPRALLIAATIALAACSIWFAADRAQQTLALERAAPVAALRAAGRPLTEEQKKLVAPLDAARKTFHPATAEIAQEVRARTALPTLEGWSFGMWREYNLDLEMWLTVLESLGFMLIGMALFRTGILTGSARSATYRRLMLIGYPAGLAVRGYIVWWQSRSGFDIDPARFDAVQAALRGLLFEPARLLITLGHLGLIVTFYRSGALGRAWPLRALGRMALTVYFLESILTSLLFYALGYVGAFGFATLMAIAAAIWVLCAAFCTAWLSASDMGPAERLLRAVAYATFRRRKPEAAAVLNTAPAI